MEAPVTLLVVLLLPSSLSVPVPRPPNWLRQCRASTNSSITALEVLPGGGWDNLRNVDMGRVMNLSYFHCQTTEDGFYLIPDEVFVVPQKETGVETSSEIISTWTDQRSTTSYTINADVAFLTLLNGKFSVENQRMKSHQVKDSSTTTRVQVRNLMYVVKTYPDFTLDSRFAQQAKEIADAIENNQTRNADYLSEKMVLDYGTHVITSLDAGATLVQEDYLRSSYVADSASDSSGVKAAAGFNFFDKLKFDISSESNRTSASLQAYRSNLQYSLTRSHGSAPFYPGITLQRWQEQTANNLVAIDRAGLPLHYVLNANTLPDLPQPTLEKLSARVGRAVRRYYAVNTRPGCIDADSKNFNFQANVDDASCEGPATNLSFGGLYQQCAPLGDDAGPLCEELAQKNPATGAFSCPPPYGATLLRSEEKQQSYRRYQCHDHYYSCGLLGLFECHQRLCGDRNYVRSARISTFWCSVAGEAPQDSGFLFGGVYGPSSPNPLTNSKSCPSDFIPLTFLSDGQKVCVSRDYEGATKFSVPFAGLFSCQSDNPLAGNRRRCPPRFSQHLAAVSDGCEVLYCVQSGNFTGGQLLPVRLPPFTRPPLVSVLATNTVMVMTEGEKSWVRVGHTKMWKLADRQEMMAILKSIRPDSGGLSGGQKAGVAFAVIGLMVLVVMGGAFWLRRRRRSLSRSRGGYVEIREEVDHREGDAILPPDETS